MADISKITDANGNTYNLKDATARGGIVPSGGTAGQVLTQTALGPAWEDQQGGGTVDTVNGISPDTNKNVQVDVELTQAEYDALPSSKNTDNVNYWIKDGINNPVNNTINGSGVSYDNTDSGLTATNVQGALDELSSGLTSVEGQLISTVEISTATFNSTYVKSGSGRVFKTGRIVHVTCLVVQGTPDWTIVCSNLPAVVTGTRWSGSAFWMSSVDATKGLTCYINGTSIQLRTSTAVEGTSGVLLSISYISNS